MIITTGKSLRERVTWSPAASTDRRVWCSPWAGIIWTI